MSLTLWIRRARLAPKKNRLCFAAVLPVATALIAVAPGVAWAQDQGQVFLLSTTPAITTVDNGTISHSLTASTTPANADDTALLIGSINSLTVRELNHARAQEVTLTLEHAGTTITFLSGQGGNNALSSPGSGYSFGPNGSAAFTGSSGTIPTGVTYAAPLLSGFNGLVAGGVFTLSLTDTASGNPLTYSGFNLFINYAFANRYVTANRSGNGSSGNLFVGRDAQNNNFSNLTVNQTGGTVFGAANVYNNNVLGVSGNAQVRGGLNVYGSGQAFFNGSAYLTGNVFIDANASRRSTWLPVTRLTVCCPGRAIW